MKDGKQVRCGSPKAYLGQVLVLTRVSFDGYEHHPLKDYEQPSIFTVVDVKKIDDYQNLYDLRDAKGKVLHGLKVGIGFHDADEWAKWDKAKHEEDERRLKARIAHLESLHQLLRGILVDQGIKVISPEQSKALGITA